MALGFNPEDFLNSPWVHLGLNTLAQQRNPGEGPFAAVARGAIGGLGSYQTHRANQQAAQDALLQRQMAQMKIDQFKKQQAARERLSGSIRSGIKPQAFNQMPEETARGNELEMIAGTLESGLDLGDTSSVIKALRGTPEREHNPIIEDVPISETHSRKMISYDRGQSWLPFPGSQPRPIFKQGPDAVANATAISKDDKAVFDFAGKLRDDYRQDAKTVREMGTTIDTILTLMNDNSPASDVAIQRQVSSLFNAGQRAASEVAAWKNFGNLPTRVVGALSRFAAGTYTSTQKEQLRNLVTAMKTQLVDPTETALEDFYGGAAERFKVPREIVVGPKQGARKQDKKPSDMSDDELKRALGL